MVRQDDVGREVAAMLRLSQFGLIPAIEILTSPPLKRHVANFFKMNGSFKFKLK
jgi:hypothetical protein